MADSSTAAVHADYSVITVRSNKTYHLS